MKERICSKMYDITGYGFSHEYLKGERELTEKRCIDKRKREKKTRKVSFGKLW
jgi:hypothetical protein